MLDGDDHAVRLWAMDGADVREYRGYTASAYTFALSPDERWLAAHTAVDVWVWDVATGEARALHGHEGWVVRLWDTATGASRVFQGHARTIDSLAFTPDGRTLISGDDRSVRLWTADLGHSEPEDPAVLRRRLEVITDALLDGENQPRTPFPSM